MKIEIDYNETTISCKVDGVDLNKCDLDTKKKVLVIFKKTKKLSSMRKFNGVWKPVQQYTKEGEFVAEFKSIADAGRQTGINPSCISNCCMRKGREFAGNYQWKYADDIVEIKPKGKVILQYSMDGTLINMFSTIAEVSLKTNINYQSIYNCISGKYKTCNGFIWKRQNIAQTKNNS